MSYKNQCKENLLGGELLRIILKKCRLQISRKCSNSANGVKVTNNCFWFINVFRKYRWIRPLNGSKIGETVSDAFKTIFKEGRKPEYLWTYKGKEF